MDLVTWSNSFESIAFKLPKDVQGDLYNTPTCSRLPLGNNRVVHSASMPLLVNECDSVVLDILGKSLHQCIIMGVNRNEDTFTTPDFLVY